MNGNGRPIVEQTGLQHWLEKIEIKAGSCRTNQPFIWYCRPPRAADCLSERDVLVHVGFRGPKDRDVWFVEEFPEYAATGKVLRGSYGPSRKRLPGRFSAHCFVCRVERISVIENEQRANSVFVQRAQQTLVRRKIIATALTLGQVPFEIHSYPAEPGVGNHLHFAWLWIGE